MRGPVGVVSRRSSRWTDWAITTGCTILASLPFVVPPRPVSSDLVKHLLVARVLSEYHSPVLAYSESFALDLRPRPTLLPILVLAGLMKVMDPFTAAKAFYVFLVVGLVASGRYLMRAVRAPPVAAVALLPLVHTTLVLGGVLPYATSIPLYPALLGVLLRTRPGWWRSVGLAVILLALYGCHIVSAAMGIFSVIVLTARDGWREKWRDFLALVPVAALLLAFLALKEGGGFRLYYYPLWGHVKFYLAMNVFGLSRLSGYLLLLLLLALGGGVLLRLLRREASTQLTWLAIGLVIIGLLSPYMIGGWYIVGSRTLPFASVAAVASLRLRGWWVRSAIAGASVFLAVSGTLNSRAALAVQPLYQEFLSGLSVVEPGSRILPIIQDPTLGGTLYVQPFVGIEDAYNIDRGGSNPYAFAAPARHIRPAPAVDTLPGRGAVGALLTGATPLRFLYPTYYAYRFSSLPPDYRGVFQVYDYVIMMGWQPEVAHVLETEGRLLHRRGQLFIYGR
jgi:hypothetical protein